MTLKLVNICRDFFTSQAEREQNHWSGLKEGKGKRKTNLQQKKEGKFLRGGSFVAGIALSI